MNNRFNLKRDEWDDRDFLYERVLARISLPHSFDLRDQCPPVWDQGSQGSCSSHAGCACRSMLDWPTLPDLSRAYLYYKERLLEGTTKEDSGSTIRNICKATQKFGICPSCDMPYREDDFLTIPSAQADAHAAVYQIKSYRRLLTLNGVKEALVSRRQPVLTGMTVFESMESDAVAKSGILPMPKKGEQKIGGHAVLIVGYQDDETKFFKKICRCIFGKSLGGTLIVRNSWGESWGQSGYFRMPYSYFQKYAFDWWIMDK